MDGIGAEVELKIGRYNLEFVEIESEESSCAIDLEYNPTQVVLSHFQLKCYSDW